MYFCLASTRLPALLVLLEVTKLSSENGFRWYPTLECAQEVAWNYVDRNYFRRLHDSEK